MKKFDYETAMAAYLESHPFLQERAQIQAVLAEVLANVPALAFPKKAELKKLVKAGVPLLQQAEWQEKAVTVMAKELPELLQKLAKAELPQQMQKAAADWSALADDNVKMQELCQVLLQQKDAELQKLVQTDGIEEALVRMLGWALVDKLVPAEAKQPQLWQELGWQRNYCPVCGRKPVMSQLRKEENGHARFLVCDGCHAEWPFHRTTCAYCGNDDLKKMHVLEPEGEEKLRLDVCDACHHYIKTYIDEGEEPLYLQDWTSLHLDFACEEQGLKKDGSVLVAEQ